MHERRAVRVHRVVEGPPGARVLVLSNSLGTSLEMWDAQASALSRQLRVVRYDTRGHGRSPVPPGPYDVADLGADLLALIDELGEERVHLAGISLGGLTSLWLAAHAPERVASVTVLSAAARFPSPNLYLERAALVRARGTAAVSDAVVSRWLTPSYAAEHPEVAAGLRSMIERTPAEGYASCCEAVGGADLGPALDSIRAAALCVAAAEDPALPVADVQSLARRLPEGRFVLVERAAHLLNVERPAEVARLIADHANEAIASEAFAAASRAGGKPPGEAT
jgi:3-oxoadipate enol-lactonase